MSRSKNRVVNTHAEAVHDPLGTAIQAAAIGNMVEAQEARGQVQFVESDILPTELRSYRTADHNYDGDSRKLLESWGFVFGKVVGGDSMFQQAKLPPGWEKQRTDHSMWSRIVDDKGRERCSIFYKAAFYDRSAFLNVEPRFVATTECEDPKNYKSRRRGVVKDGNTVLFQGGWHEYDALNDPAQKEARAWFEAHGFPENDAEQWSQP